MARNPFDGTRPFTPTDGRGPAADRMRRGAERADRYAKALNKYGQGTFTDLSVTAIADDLDQYTHVGFSGKDWEEEENFDPNAEEVQVLAEGLNDPMRERFFEEAVSEEHARDLSRRLKEEQTVYENISTSMGASILGSILSMTKDPVFIGTTAATMGVGSGINALARGIQLSVLARGALAMGEVIGTSTADAALYSGLKAYNNDNFTQGDAMVETGYALLLAAPIGGAVGGITARSARKVESAAAKQSDEAVVSNIAEQDEATLWDREFIESKVDAEEAANMMVDDGANRAVAQTMAELSPEGRLDVVKATYMQQVDDPEVPKEVRQAAERELSKISKGESQWNQRVKKDSFWQREPEKSQMADDVMENIEESNAELDEMELKFKTERESWAGRIHRQDLYGTIQKSLSPTMRGVGNELYSNPIRSKNQPEQTIAADLLSQAKSSGIIEKTNYKLAKKVQKYLKRNKVNKLNINKQYELTEEMGDRIFDIIVTGQKSGIKELDEAAEVIQERVEEGLTLAKRYGAEGAEELVSDPRYLPRVYKPVRVQKALNEPGGEGRMVSMFRNALEETNGSTLPKGAAELIARGMVRTLRRDKMESLDDIFKDKEKMREVLEEIAMEDTADGQSVDEYLDEVFEVLAERKENKQTNKKDYIDRFKKRADLNIFAQSDDGQLTLRDLLDTNAFGLTEQYTREMAGEAALASKGLSGPAEIRKLRDTIKNELIKSEPDSTVVNKELERFDTMIDNVRNRPTHFKGMTAKQKAAMSAALQYNSLVMLGMAGPAGMAEFVGATFRGGVAATLKAVPALRKNSLDLAKEIEKQGFAMDKMYYSMYFNHYEETGLYGATSFAARFGHASMKTVTTVSLMRGFDQFARRTLWTVALDKSAQQARKNGKLFFTREEMGLSKVDYDKVVGHMQNSVDSTPGVFSDSVNTMSFEKWLRSDGEVDEELIDKFLSGMYRMSSNQTLRVLSGERVRWTEGPLGQFLFQFQTLLLSGIYKSLGNKVANLDQAATYTTFMGEVMGGTMWYMARNQIKKAGMSDRQKKEWDEEHMTTKKIATGGMGYTTSFGGAFSLYNKASTPFGFPAIGQRYSSSAADALVANPTLAMGESAAKVIGDVAQLKADKDTARNAMGLLPLKSWYPVYYINNSIMDE